MIIFTAKVTSQQKTNRPGIQLVFGWHTSGYVAHVAPRHVVWGCQCHVFLTCHISDSPRHVSVRKTFLWRHRDMSRHFTTCRDIWWHVMTNVATCHRCCKSCNICRVTTYRQHLRVEATYATKCTNEQLLMIWKHHSIKHNQWQHWWHPSVYCDPQKCV